MKRQTPTSQPGASDRPLPGPRLFLLGSLTILLGLLANDALHAEEPRQARWVLELGTADFHAVLPEDGDCPDLTDGEPLLRCHRPLSFNGDRGGSWAIGVDVPLIATPGQGSWHLGVRLGRHGPANLDGEMPDAVGGRLQGRLGSDYALLQLQREFPRIAGGLGFNMNAGVGVARVAVRDLQRLRADQRWQAEGGDRSGYLLRLGLGVDWRFESGNTVGLLWQHDALDGYASDSGEGRFFDGEDWQPQSFAAVRGGLARQSLSLKLTVPFRY
ncbi:hypothetical protein VCB98_04135 [Gammaproteobacteria bacterium AB-CW1]|uniref:Uncharacterized protein n=1 Tax=Natronospira elongata TaxID=3110268 RepID=A0AAP6JDI9_9GAMM|nr:hypothetical protein [Gammaproteobacteria bacterium AB-CW1]